MFTLEDKTINEFERTRKGKGLHSIEPSSLGVGVCGLSTLRSRQWPAWRRAREGGRALNKTRPNPRDLVTEGQWVELTNGT
jgi:hypothetical protein